jgi:hypothetical protein
MLWERGGSCPTHLDRRVPWRLLPGPRQREWMQAEADTLQARAKALNAHADTLERLAGGAA